MKRLSQLMASAVSAVAAFVAGTPGASATPLDPQSSIAATPESTRGPVVITISGNAKRQISEQIALASWSQIVPSPWGQAGAQWSQIVPPPWGDSGSGSRQQLNIKTPKVSTPKIETPKVTTPKIP